MAEFSNRIYVPTYKCIYKLQTGAPTLNTCPFFWGGGGRGGLCAKIFSINTHNMRLLISVIYFEKYKILDYSISITYCL